MKTMLIASMVISIYFLIYNNTFCQDSVDLSNIQKSKNMKSIQENKKVVRNLNEETFLIDKFFVPKGSIQEFVQRLNYNINYIKTLPGFLNDNVYEQTFENGDLIIITVAHWENIDFIENAKKSVFTEFKRINFNPGEFYQRLNIKMERGIFKKTVFN
jgi:heme-degrading monooxygenase HmoA